MKGAPSMIEAKDCDAIGACPRSCRQRLDLSIRQLANLALAVPDSNNSISL